MQSTSSKSISLPYLSIKPNQLTQYYQSETRMPSANVDTNESKQPRNNDPKRGLSKKARKRIQSKIQWLLTFSKRKRVFNDHTNKFFTFRINFITLTLPALQAHSDQTIKSKCLNQFITELRNNFDLNNYIWRAEAQSNGNIHFHFVTDTYFPWFVLRTIWNRQLRKLGYIQRYKDKFKNMSKEDYINLNSNNNAGDLSTILTRWNYGNKTNWSNPNTTDIHSVGKVNNLAAYLSKYMSKDEGSKDEDGRFKLKYRKIKGRIWGCSESLSRCKSIINLLDSTYSNLLDTAAEVQGAFILKEDYFNFIGVQFNQLGKYWRKVINQLFLEYKDKIDYISGGIPDKRYRYT